MATQRIDANQFAESLINVLKEFAGATEEVIETECESISKESLKKLKEDSPRDTGDYAKHWVRQKNKKGSFFEWRAFPGRRPWATRNCQN